MGENIICQECESEFAIKLSHTFLEGVKFCPCCGTELDLEGEEE